MTLDTIPGRQCMASCFFLLQQFEDSLTYLNSVKVLKSIFIGVFGFSLGSIEKKRKIKIKEEDCSTPRQNNSV